MSAILDSKVLQESKQNINANLESYGKTQAKNSIHLWIKI